MRKHLYEIHDVGYIHSNVCWCQQARQPDVRWVELKDTDIMRALIEFRLMYPHEASDKMCRCETPCIRVDSPVDSEGRRKCVLCGKSLPG